MTGNVIILITKGTPDEGYYWAAKRREKRMISELELLRSKLSKRMEDSKSLYDEEWKILSRFMTKNQKKLRIKKR